MSVFTADDSIPVKNNSTAACSSVVEAAGASHTWNEKERSIILRAAANVVDPWAKYCLHEIPAERIYRHRYLPQSHVRCVHCVCAGIISSVLNSTCVYR